MIITLDFETYYAKDYGLKKYTIEEYVRDPRFEVIMVSIKVGKNPTYWITGTHRQIKDALWSLDWENGFLLAHNTRFDGFILFEKFGLRPKGYLDTLAMARPIHGAELGLSLGALAEKYKIGHKGKEVLDAIGKRRSDFSDGELERYAGYCVNDTDLCRNLYDILKTKVPKIELQIIDLTLRMFCEPVLRLDTAFLEKRLLNLQLKKQELLDKADKDREALLSNDKFAEALQELGVVPPRKVSKTTGKETWAFAKTDEEFKELLDHPDLEVQTLMGARFGIKSTLEETRTQRFIDISKRGLLPIPIQYYAAHTGRFGGTDGINIQNLPSRGAGAGELKRAILAPEGYIMVDCDSSQIEARVLAWLSGQTDLLDAFKNKEDVYKKMASSIYKKPVDKITKEERFIGKSVVLGCGYGMGAQKFGLQLKAQAGVTLSEQELDRIVKAYRASVPYIVFLWKAAGNCIEHILNKDWDPKEFRFGATDALKFSPHQGFILPNGFIQSYPGLRREGNDYYYNYRKKLVRLYGPKVIENLCQAIARCIIAEQMVEISKRYRIVLTVHDSIVAVAKEVDKEAAKDYIETVMRTSPNWAEDLPLDCESSVGYTYGG